MDLDELRGFLTVIETGSMLGAATRLGVPRGTLRRRIDALEARAGVPLLERNARGVTATEAGTLLAERGQALLQQGTALLSAVRDMGRDPVGTLRIQLPLGLPPSGMLTVFEMHRSVYSALRVDLRIRHETTEGPLEDVDILIHFGDRAPTGSWVTRELLRVPVRVLASPTVIARTGRPDSVEALQEHPLASWVEPGDPGTRWPLRTGGSVPVRPTLVTNDPHLLRQYARAGVVMVLVPDAALDLLGLPMDELVPVLDDVVGRDVSLCVSIPEALVEDPKITTVLDLWSTLFARIPPST